MKKIFFLLFVTITGVALHAQNVGIGTAAPLEKLHVSGGTVRVSALAGVGTRVVGSDPNGTLLNIAPGSTGQVLTQTAAGPVWQDNVGQVASVSLGADIFVTTNAFANVAGMSVSFTATKTTALVVFSASGFGYTNSMSFVQFRIRNTTTASNIGGTNTKIQSYDDTRGTITPWSCTFTKLMTGLTPGTTYTLQVQALRDGIYGTYDAAIFCASNPDSHHMTLNVIY